MATFPTAPCGKHGLVLPRIGLGTMGITAFYVSTPGAFDDDGLATIERALALGSNHLDTAWIYQNKDTDGNVHYNEAVVGRAIAKHGRDKFIIATKFGFRADFSLDSSEEGIHRQLEESLARLGTTYVDLYYQHRQDPNTPIEQVAATLEKLRQAGKIKYIGFSEITADELRRVSAICPVSAIQMEYSLQAREIENAIIPTARELGVGIVAYSPLGRGLLSRTFTGKDQLADFRSSLPRLQDDSSFDAAARLEAIAVRLGLAPATLALAWLLAKGDDIFPIPGSKRPERVEQNLAAAQVKLTPEVVAEIETAVPPAVLPRYPEGFNTASWEARAGKV